MDADNGTAIREALRTGKELEQRVAQAYREMGARKVEQDTQLAGNQIDVIVWMEAPDHSTLRIAIEAKDWSRRVGLDVVNRFAAIMNLLRDSRLIDEGIIISARGFTRQAREAAQTHRIRLLELSDLDEMTCRAKVGASPVPVRAAYSSIDADLDPETLCDQYRSARYAFEIYRALSWEIDRSEWGRKVASLRGLLASQGAADYDCCMGVPHDSRFTRVAILCGVPRWWNIRTIMKLASLGEDERGKAEHLYRWLSATPFSVEYGDWGKSYLFDVRCGLQRYIRQQDSIDWRQAHQELVAFWDQRKAWLEQPRSDSGELPSDQDIEEIWEYQLNILYHNLCRKSNLCPVLAEACRQMLEVDTDPERCVYRLNRLSEIMRDANWFCQDSDMEHWANSIASVASVLDRDRDDGGEIHVDHRALLKMFWDPMVEEDVLGGFPDRHLRGLVWVRIGESRQERGDDLGALLAAYQQAGSDFAPALIGQGRAYLRWGKYPEAIQCFDHALEIDGPSFDQVAAHRGRAYHLCGRWQDALKDFECAISLQPDIGWAWLELAQVHQHLGNYEEAQRGFQRAIALGSREEPEILAAYYGLAEVCERLEDYGTAIEAVSFLIQQTPEEDNETLAGLFSRRASLLSMAGDEVMAGQDREWTGELAE